MIRKNFSLLLPLLALLLLSAIISGPYKPTATASAECIRFQNADGLEERILRVESGLLLPVVIKGRADSGMKLAERMRFYKTPGLSITVINNGAIEWARGYGVQDVEIGKPVTVETLFQAASISKPVAAMGALTFVEKGKLNLDGDVNEKLVLWKVPDKWKTLAPDATKDKRVTLRGIVTHSAGLTVHGFRGYAAGEEVPSLVQILGGQKPANSAAIQVNIVPGSKWRYSGGGYTVMQQMIIDVTRKGFPDFMQEAVLSPVGMKHSTYQQPLPEGRRASAATGHRSNGKAIEGKWHTYPEMAAAGLWTTPSDLARFAIELQKSRAGKSNRVLSRAMAVQMTTKQFENWGLGLAVEGEGKSLRFSHGGSNEGFRCIMVAYTDTGQGAVIMTNCDNGGALMAEILRAVAREYDWPDYQPKERDVAKVDPAIYKAYAGRYEITPSNAGTVTVENGRLYIFAPALSTEKLELHPESDVKYFLAANNAAITFVRDERGAVSEMIIERGRQTLKAKKVE
ncbi:MAG: serine hydrolase [Blastocatellia bacterium]|nr:serine hydrolase [Blastocatellia bacterium]